jgi:hypothetical protein
MLGLMVSFNKLRKLDEYKNLEKNLSRKKIDKKENLTNVILR